MRTRRQRLLKQELKNLLDNPAPRSLPRRLRQLNDAMLEDILDGYP
jgi:hypothetical protein